MMTGQQQFSQCIHPLPTTTPTHAVVSHLFCCYRDVFDAWAQRKIICYENAAKTPHDAIKSSCAHSCWAPYSAAGALAISRAPSLCVSNSRQAVHVPWLLCRWWLVLPSTSMSPSRFFNRSCAFVQRRDSFGIGVFACSRHCISWSKGKIWRYNFIPRQSTPLSFWHSLCLIVPVFAMYYISNISMP